MERQQRIAVVPGSFDPITKGHMDIIRRAKPLFDKVIVLVVINAVKNPCFSLQERVELIRRVEDGGCPAASDFRKRAAATAA